MSAGPEVFAALADPTRWQVLDLLGRDGGGTATTLAAQLPVSRVAVVKHLGVLDRAGLVTSERRGREVRYAVQTDGLLRTAHWMTSVAAGWDARLDALKALAEGDD